MFAFIGCIIVQKYNFILKCRILWQKIFIGALCFFIIKVIGLNDFCSKKVTGLSDFCTKFY